MAQIPCRVSSPPSRNRNHPRLPPLSSSFIYTMRTQVHHTRVVRGVGLTLLCLTQSCRTRQQWQRLLPPRGLHLQHASNARELAQDPPPAGRYGSRKVIRAPGVCLPFCTQARTLQNAGALGDLAGKLSGKCQAIHRRLLVLKMDLRRLLTTRGRSNPRVAPRWKNGATLKSRGG